MTTVEAIEQLHALSIYFDKYVPAMGGEALHMAIDALLIKQEAEEQVDESSCRL